MPEFRVSIYDGSNGIIMTAYGEGKPFTEGQGEVIADENILYEALQKVKEALIKNTNKISNNTYSM